MVATKNKKATTSNAKKSVKSTKSVNPPAQPQISAYAEMKQDFGNFFGKVKTFFKNIFSWIGKAIGFLTGAMIIIAILGAFLYFTGRMTFKTSDGKNYQSNMSHIFQQELVEKPVEQKATVQSTNIPTQNQSSPSNGVDKISFGEYGTYAIVNDSNRNQDTLGWSNENMIVAGTKNLSDLKRDGGTVTFVMPKNGWINNSAGSLVINGIEWTLGNYGENQLSNTMVYAGDVITVTYGANNDSAGFQLWFEK